MKDPRSPLGLHCPRASPATKDAGNSLASLCLGIAPGQAPLRGKTWVFSACASDVAQATLWIVSAVQAGLSNVLLTASGGMQCSDVGQHRHITLFKNVIIFLITCHKHHVDINQWPSDSLVAYLTKPIFVFDGNFLQPPKVESLNGLLLGYRIYYRELEYESAGPGPESKSIKNPSALQAELMRE